MMNPAPPSPAPGSPRRPGSSGPTATEAMRLLCDHGHIVSVKIDDPQSWICKECGSPARAVPPRYAQSATTRQTGPGPFAGPESAPLAGKHDPDTRSPSARDEGTSLVCPNCSQEHHPGTGRCTSCRTRLRPFLFTIFMLFGTAINVFASLAAVIVMVEKGPRLEGTLDLALAIAASILYFNTDRGRYWAWRWLQLYFLVRLVVSLTIIGVLSDGLRPVDVPAAFAPIALIVIVWGYLRTRPIRAYCGANR